MIKHITETEALDFVSKQEHKDEWHKDFYYWKRHLLALKNWPWLKKFYKGGKWLGHFDEELNGIYWYNLIEDEMYDGFLISKKHGAGIKLARELVKITKGQWRYNWTMCSKEYIKFNNRLGFQGTSYANITPWDEVYLLWR